MEQLNRAFSPTLSLVLRLSHFSVDGVELEGDNWRK